jgi:hypothetical protein
MASKVAGDIAVSGIIMVLALILVYVGFLSLTIGLSIITAIIGMWIGRYWL